MSELNEAGDKCNGFAHYNIEFMGSRMRSHFLIMGKTDAQYFINAINPTRQEIQKFFVYHMLGPVRFVAAGFYTGPFEFGAPWLIIITIRNNTEVFLMIHNC